MKRFFTYSILVICIAIYVMSWSQPLTTKLTELKLTNSSIFGSDRYRYGDLYGMSYLSSFRKNFKTDNPIKYTNYNVNANTDLYVLCDSYLLPLDSKKYFCGVSTLKRHWINWTALNDTVLNTSKNNVLLIEFTERNVRPFLNDITYINSIITSNTSAGTKTGQGNVKSIKSTIFDFIFNRKMDANLESNFWDMALFTPIKEWKADLNYHLFNQVNDDVTISKNGERIYYKATIDTTDVTSSFKQLTDGQVDTLVNQLNKLYDKGKRMGFNHIYLSIIPNPISILDSTYIGLTYNNLVARVQNNPKLKLSCIDIVPEFKKLGPAVYQKSDTHWNTYGLSLWLNKFNNELFHHQKDK